MKLSSILNKDLIVLNVKAHTKRGAIEELIDVVCRQYKDLDKQELFRAIMYREAQQSTYLGKSLALPHARIDGLNDFIIACGRSDEGLHFEETTDAVTFVVMILSCKTKINILLQTMAAFAAIFSNDDLVTRMTTAASVDEFMEVIEASTVEVKHTLVAKDIMQKDIITLSLDWPLKKVLDIFFTENISGAPVVNADGTIAGVVTEKEIIRIGFPPYMDFMDNISFLDNFEPFEEVFKKEDEIFVKDMYTKDYVFVHENVSVIQLAFYFVHRDCRRILVIDDNKKLLGLIMRKDVIRKVIHA